MRYYISTRIIILNNIILLSKVKVMALSKEEILNLIRSNSDRINLCKHSQFIINNPELFQIEIDGILMSTYIYCMICKSLIKKFKWSTGHLSRHCRTDYHIFNQSKSQYLSENCEIEKIVNNDDTWTD